MNVPTAPRHPVPAGRCRLPFAAIAVLIALLVPSHPVSAADECPGALWSRYPGPTHEGHLVVPGSDISAFDIAASGDTIYAIGTWNPPDECIDNSYSDENISDGQAPRLWKSSDGGTTWSDLTDQVLDAHGLPDCCDDDVTWNDFVFFSAVSAAPDDDGHVVVCGYDASQQAVVVGSDDGGETFNYAGCGGITGEPLSIDLSPETDGIYTIAVGTLDLARGGSVWLFDYGDTRPSTWCDTGDDPGWTDAWQELGGTGTRLDIYAVPSVRFSPSFADDRSIIATIMAYAEEADGDSYTGYYIVQGSRQDDALRWNRSGGYDDMPVRVDSGDTVIAGDASLPPFFLRQAALLELPFDYRADEDDRRVLLVAVNGVQRDTTSGTRIEEGGFLYALDASGLSRDLLRRDRNPHVSSITYHGSTALEGQALAGCLLPAPYAWEWEWSNELQDWWMDNGDHDDGVNVLPCCSGPLVLMSESLDDCCPRWSSSDTSPSGQVNCQVSYTPDGLKAYATTEGDTRHGLETLHWGDESAFSISTDDRAGSTWQQTGLIDTMIDAIVGLNYSPEMQCLYIHTEHLDGEGYVCSCDSIWRTCDEGENYTRVLLGQPDQSERDDDDFDDIMGAYHRGFTVPRGSGYAYGDRARYAIGDAVDQDDQAELGFEADAVYRKLEGSGHDWQVISELTLDYDQLLLMECDDCAVPVLYVGFTNLWWDFTDNVPLPYNDDGTDPQCPAGHECRKVSGVARCMDPGGGECCAELEWDYLIRGLQGTEETDGVYEQLYLAGGHCDESGVWLWSFDDANRYWAVDGEVTSNYDWCNQEFENEAWGRLWLYCDCYACSTPEPARADESDGPYTIPCSDCSCESDDHVLEWTRPCDACEYEIQIALDPDFRHIVAETEDFAFRGVVPEGRRFYLPGEPLQPSALIEQGILECNQTYWWRVRAHMAESGEVISTWWSDAVSFRTAVPPPAAITLRSPGDGATKIPVRDVGFSWSAVPGASSYDFMLLDSSRGHVASMVGDITALVVPGPLEPETSYIWRVRALDGETVISESIESTFRTRSVPTPQESSDTRPEIVAPARSGIPEWAPYFVGVVAGLLLATLVTLFLGNRRLGRPRLKRPRSIR
ncbi:MAG: hypothetical protein ACOC9B_02220 [Chloroflexota bacterium]